MKVPYALVAAVDNGTRHANMAAALKTGKPRLKPQPIDETRSMSLACYGPSLEDTWQDLTRPIISVSGALQFLAERGVVPDYHVEVDPRAHKILNLIPVVPGVKYLIASCCHPKIWHALKGEDVSIFHVYSSDDTQKWIEAHDPGQFMIRPGSTVGLTALHVGGLLGSRHFEIHGMDGSLRDGRRHAGPHFGHPQGGITWDADRITWQTSKIMANACAETINTLMFFPVFCVFHGDGLQQRLLDEQYGLDNAARAGTPKAEVVRKARCVIYEKAA